MKRFLLDEGLSRRTAELLRLEGMDAIHVSDVGLSQAADEQVVGFARKTERVVVTLDADFHQMLALTGAADPSVVRIHAESLKAYDAYLMIMSLVRSLEEVTQGACVAVSLRRGTARIHRLPFHGSMDREN